VPGLLVVAAPALAQTDPVDDTEAEVADARAAADRAAGNYLDLLTRSEALDQEMATTEQQLQEMSARIDELRDEMEGRAVAAYVRAGSTELEFGLGNDEVALEVARRGALLNRLNRSDNELASHLSDLQETFAAKRDKLKADRAAYEQTLTLLRDEQAQLDAKLAKVQAAHNAALVKAQPAPAPGAPAPAPTAAPAPAPAPAPTSANVPAAPTPPPSYTPTPGEHPQHWDSFLACTRTVESGGNYQAYNPQGPWYGAYQFLQSTWNSAANHANRPELIGLDPRRASEYDQDDMAWTLYQWQGKGPWGDRC
jgi:prefoldin subunit 5